MLESPKKLIPLAILTGYIGVGKTTLINRILQANHGLKIAILVRDMGSIHVDSQMIVGRDSEMVTLANGCIFRSLRGDLVQTINDLLNLDSPPEYIILEQRGITDPAQTVLKINRSYLRNHVRIDSIIAVVDVEQFKTRGVKPENLLNKQIRLADVVILNKADLVDEATMAKAQEWVGGVINRASVFEATECNVPLDKVLSIGTYNPQTAFDTSGHGVHAYDIEELDEHQHHDQSIVYATWAWECEEALVFAEVRRVLDDLPMGVFRAKGVLYLQEMPDKKVVLQLVNNRVRLSVDEAWGDKSPKTSLVIMGEVGAFKRKILDLLFDQTRASSALETASAVTEVIDDTMEWLRVQS